MTERSGITKDYVDRNAVGGRLEFRPGDEVLWRSDETTSPPFGFEIVGEVCIELIAHGFDLREDGVPTQEMKRFKIIRKT